MIITFFRTAVARILILFLFVGVNKIFSQEFKWDSISFNIQGERIFNRGDFHNYWGDGTAFGIGFNYKLNKKIVLTGDLTIAKFISNKEVPDFYFIVSQLGVKLNFIKKIFQPLFVSAGLSNNSFLFKFTEGNTSNNIEHEFGVYFSTGLEMRVLGNILELFFEYHNIFSEPLKIKFTTAGIRYQIF